MPLVEYILSSGAWSSCRYGKTNSIDSTNARSGLVAGTYLPGVDTTGVLTVPTNLAQVTGVQTFSTDNQLIDGRIFFNKVSISGKNIKFRNCWFVGFTSPTSISSTASLDAMVVSTNSNASGTIFEDCTFDPSYSALAGLGTEDVYRSRFMRNGFQGHHATFIRCEFRYTVDAISVTVPDVAGVRADVVLSACWIHSLTMYSPDSNSNNYTHNDGIQWFGGKGLTVIGSRIEGFYNTKAGDATVDRGTGTDGNPYFPSLHTTSCILSNKSGNRDAPDELVLMDNWFNGGASAINLGGGTGWFSSNLNKITGNRFGYDYRLGSDYAILAKSDAIIDISGNFRWGGAAEWTHGNEESVSSLDKSASFNTRKNG